MKLAMVVVEKEIITVRHVLVVIMILKECVNKLVLMNTMQIIIHKLVSAVMMKIVIRSAN